MNIINAILYDPAVAATHTTSAAAAMSALDTTNLRLPVMVPLHGIVTFRIRCIIHGGVTFPQILLGVMNGATIVGRMAPRAAVGGTALATTFLNCDVEFTVSGLTPGSTDFDAAYSIETVTASGQIKYGGPNDATTNNAFGGFLFEAWDPRPSGANLTSLGDSRISNLDTTVSSRSTFSGGAVASVTAAVTLPAIPSDWITAAGIAASAGAEIADAVWDEVTSGHLTSGTTGAAVVAAGTAGDPWSTSIPGSYGVGTAGFILGTNLNASVSSRSTYSGGDTAGTTTLLSRVPTFPSNFTTLAITAGGVVKSDVDTIKTQTVTCTSGVTVLASVGTSSVSVAQSGDAFARIGVSGAALTALGDTRLAHLDVAVSSRSTFAGGAVASVTGPVTLPTIPAGWITAGGIAASALNGKGDWNIGKTGYALTQTFPTNFAAMSLTAGGLVTLAAGTHTGAVIPTVSSVTGLTAAHLDAPISSRSTYAGGDTAGTTTLLSRVPSFPANFSSLAITVGGVVKSDVDTIKTQTVTCAGGVTILASVGTTTISTAQSGDAFARIGEAGAALTALGDLRLAHLDVAVSSRSSYSGGDTAGTTTLLSRIPSALTITSGKVDVNDKTGFSLSAGGLNSVTAWTVNITGNLLGSVNSVVDAPWTLLG